jgi:ABC-2 type transport system permease protein
VLLLCCFVSVGLAASSLSENMMISAIVGFAILLLFWVIEIGTVVAQSGWIKETLEAMSIVGHLENFTRGMLDSRDVIYMASFSIFFLFLAQQRVESLRWK